jgi:hypothetical protein
VNARGDAVKTTDTLEDQDVRTFFKGARVYARRRRRSVPSLPCNAPSAGLLGISFLQVNRGNCDSKISFVVGR